MEAASWNDFMLQLSGGEQVGGADVVALLPNPTAGAFALLLPLRSTTALDQSDGQSLEHFQKLESHPVLFVELFLSVISSDRMSPWTP